MERGPQVVVANLAEFSHLQRMGFTTIDRELDFLHRISLYQKVDRAFSFGFVCCLIVTEEACFHRAFCFGGADKANYHVFAVAMQLTLLCQFWEMCLLKPSETTSKNDQIKILQSIL